MNMKAVLGLLAAIIVLVGAFFFANHKAAAPVVVPTATSTLATTTAPATSSPSSAVKPTFPAAPAPATKPQATQTGVVRVPKVVTVNASSLTTTNPRPTISGTASTNVTSVGYVLDNPDGVGIAGSYDIPVVQGAWQFTAPQMLKPGSYTLHILGGDAVQVRTLVVTGS
jgi:hypothetical protein